MNRQRKQEDHERLTKKFIEFFGCDTARILNPSGKNYFLILGYNMESKGEWSRDGVPVTFTFTKEKVVASGSTLASLIADAKDYKLFSEMTAPDFVKYLNNKYKDVE